MKSLGFAIKRVAGPAVFGVALATLITTAVPAVPAAWWLSVASVVLSALLLHGPARLFSRREITIPGVWWFSFLAMVFLPAHLVILDDDSSHARVYMLALQVVLVGVPLGVVVATRMAGAHRREIQAFTQAPVSRAAWEDSVFLVYLLLLAGGLALTIAYFREAPAVPIVYILRNPGDSLGLALLREESFKLLDSPLLYSYDVLRRVLFPFLVSVALGYYAETRRRKWLVALVVCGLGAVALGAAAAAKLPVAALVLVVAMFWYLYWRGSVRVRTVIVLVVLFLAFPAFVLLVSAPDDEAALARISALLAQRMFYSPAEDLLWYFEIFPDEVGFLYGRTVGKLSWFAGWEYFDVENYVFRRKVGGHIETGTNTAAFVGNLWADFGWLGVIGGSVAAGIVMQFVQVWLSRMRKSVVVLAAYASYLWCFAQLNLQSLAVTLLSGGVVFLAGAVLVMRAGGEVLSVSLHSLRVGRQRAAVDR